MKGHDNIDAWVNLKAIEFVNIIHERMNKLRIAIQAQFDLMILNNCGKIKLLRRIK